jgi:tRNA A37 threonylcarbamoyladenosine modification protein TsaB
VTALEAAAHGLPRPLLAALDARRGEVYLQLFGGDAPAPMLAHEEALPAWAFAATYLTGDAAAGLARLLPDAITLSQAVPAAEAIARIALDRAGRPQPRPAPLYLRPADAAPPRDPAPELIA